MLIDGIPNELLCLIAKHLDLRSLRLWSFTSRRFYTVLIEELYSNALSADEEEFGFPASLVLATVTNETAAFKGLLKRTQNIHQANIGVDVVPIAHDWAIGNRGDALRHWSTRITVFTSLLHIVCHLCRTEMTELVLMKGVDASLYDSLGWTPLHMASTSGNVTTMEVLRNGGADLDVRTQSDTEKPQTGLGLAIIYGHTAAAEWLISAGAYLASDTLPLAALHGNLVIVQRLLDLCSFDQGTLMDALFLAVKSKSETIAKLLIDAGATVSSDMLQCATRSDNLALIKLLIDAGAGVSGHNSNGKTLLNYVRSSAAARMILEKDSSIATDTLFNGISHLDLLYGMYEVQDVHFDPVPVALVLLEYGCEVMGTFSVTGSSTLTIAVGGGHWSVVEAILRKQASLIHTRNYDGGTVLHEAACPKPGAARYVRYLVERGCDVHAVDNEGRNALFYACGKAWVKVRESEIEAVTRYLVDVGVACSHKSSAGETALLTALKWKHEPAALALIDAGVDMSATNKQGETALHIASRNGYLRVVGVLLEKDVDISERTKKGETVVHLAVREGIREHGSTEGYAIMMVCILHGYCDISIQEVGGQKALESLSKTGHMEIVRQFCTLGVDISVRNEWGATAVDLVKKAEKGIPWDSIEVALRDAKGSEQLRSLVQRWTEEDDDVMASAGGLFEEI